MSIYFLPFGVPLLLLAAAAISFFGPKRGATVTLRLIEVLSIGAIIIALLSMAALNAFGPQTSPLLGFQGLGLSFRLDVISAVMVLLVSFIGWIVVRYARVYLDGEARRDAFMGWLCTTLAMVMLLVIAGNLVQIVLAWTATSLSLHRLLLFYPERAAAQRAARKKFVTARAADIALITAAALLVIAYGTTDIAAILNAARADDGGSATTAAAGLLAIAALLKSAQFPLHGWLTEVMEAPTPVSALLHIVAHSLYKAHSFLASGGAVERIAASRRPGPVAVPSVKAVGRAFLAALAIYGAIGWAFDFHHKSPQAIALGAILIFGVAYLLAQGLADTAPRALTQRMAVYAVVASMGYFALHGLALWLTAGTLPPTPTPGPLEWALIVLAVMSFGLVAIAQAMFPLWAYHPAAAGLRVHLSNGLYANALFDRLLGGWTLRQAS